MTNDKTTLDTMRQELEAGGYCVDYPGEQLMIEWSVEYGEKGVLVMRYIDAAFDDGEHYNRFIAHAYAHLREQQELADLRELWDITVKVFEYPREVEMMGANILQEKRDWFRERMEQRFNELHNITANDDDESDEA